MAEQRNFRIAIIGAGGIAGMHAKAIRDLDNAELVAISRRNEDKAKEFATEYGCEAYTDNEQMLDQVKPDLVTVCTPSGVHREAVRPCLERQIPVLCEKPLEITTERVDELIALADKMDTPLGGIFMQRFAPVMQTIRMAITAGRFGALAAVRGAVPWWREDDYYSPDRWQGKLAYDGGGALMNQAIHIVDLVQWFGGAGIEGLGEADNAVEEVFAYTGKRGHDSTLIEVEDAAVVNLRFRDGTLGQLFAATAMYPGALRRVQLGGRDGMAETLEEELVAWQFRNEQSEDEQIRSRFGQASTSSGGASDPMAIDYANHGLNIAAFLEAIQQNETFVLNAREARKAVAIIEAVYRSAETNTPQKVQ